MAKRITTNTIIRDISIVAIGVAIIWFSMLMVFGAQNPFYVVASGSMVPVLLIDDIIIVQGDCFDFFNILNTNCVKFDWYTPFESIEVGDIIVFNRPSDHDKIQKRVIVHRVASIINEDPKTIRTLGDANGASIPGTDFPITEEEYLGKVMVIIPQVGFITKIIAPPFNFILIAIIVGIIAIQQFVKKKNEKELPFTDPLDSVNPDTVEELSDIDRIRKDSEYSEHVEKTKDVTELDDTDEPENQTKTEEIDETFEGIEDSIDDKIKGKKDSKKKE